ncbi:MAG: hypothetical protein ACKOVB_06700 [Terrabacter sp.]
MFVRTTEVQADPTKVDDGIAMIRDEVFPAVTGMDGCVGMSLLVDRESGRCIATTAWQTEEATAGSADKVMSLRSRAEQSLGADGSDVRQWEVAVVHRDHAAPQGACARLTWLSGDPGMADRAVDLYRMAVLPRLEEMQGFCSASFMIDREAGRAFGTVVFDTEQSMSATGGDARGIRERTAGELGASVERVEEMELVFAHLHVPEMA